MAPAEQQGQALLHGGILLFQAVTVKVGSDRPGTQPGPIAYDSETSVLGQ